MKLALNRSQRIVLVVGIGVLLTALRDWITGRLGVAHDGWFNYAPSSGVVDRIGGWSSGSGFLLTIALAGVWVLLSLWLLRGGDRSDSTSSDS